MNRTYGRDDRGSFWEDENGCKFYFPDKKWDWSYKGNYERQDKKDRDRLRKILYGNMTGRTTIHEYSRLNFTKRLRKKLLQRQLKKQTN